MRAVKRGERFSALENKASAMADEVQPEPMDSEVTGQEAQDDTWHPVLPADVPSVVVQPKARAKRYAKAKAAPPPVPEPVPEPPVGPPEGPRGEGVPVAGEPKRRKAAPRVRTAPEGAPEGAPNAPAPTAPGKASRDVTGRFLPKSQARESQPAAYLNNAPIPADEEPESAFANIARALHNARQRDMQARQQLYHGFVHG